VAAIWGNYDQVVERLDQVVETRLATTAERCSMFGSSPFAHPLGGAGRCGGEWASRCADSARITTDRAMLLKG
jgi:hypothetical protein